MNSTPHLDLLRKRVDQALHAHRSAQPAPSSPISVQRLLEELQLYQAELEAQNLELAEVQQRLTAQARQYATLFDALPVPAMVVDDWGQVLQANQGAKRLFNKPGLPPWPLHQLNRELQVGSLHALEAARRRARLGGVQVARIDLLNGELHSSQDVHVLQLGQDFHLDERQLLLFVDRAAEQAHAWAAKLADLRLTLRQLDDPSDKLLLETAGQGLAVLCSANAWQWQVLGHDPMALDWQTRSQPIAPALPKALAGLDLAGWQRQLLPQVRQQRLLQDRRAPDAQAVGSALRSPAHLLLLSLPAREEVHPELLLSLLQHERPFSADEEAALRQVGDEMEHLLERNQRQRALRRLSRAIGQSSEGVFIANSQGVLYYVNPALEQLTERPAPALLGQSIDLLAMRHNDQTLPARHWPTLLQHGPWSGEVWLPRPGGDYWPAWLQLSAVTPAQGPATEVLGTLQDLRQRKADEQRIHQLAFYDALTGLPNRRLLHDRLRRALARQRRSDLTSVLFFIDLDDFKRINDALGHDQGDCLLQHVAHQISACLRENDTVARLGGDEFVVLTEVTTLAPGSQTLSAEHIAQKLVLAIAQPVSLLGQRVSVTPSIGIALLDDSTRTAEDVMRHADLAMYKAKGAGRGGVRFFSPAMQAEAEARSQLEADLADALAHRQLRLFYQPQVNTQGEVVGCEGLLRWQHPGRGLLAPDRFIQVAEQSGVILPVGRWVIECACMQLALWQKVPARQRWTLAVNLSAKQFRDPHLLDWVTQCLQQHHIPRGRLELELTESTLVDDLDDAVNKMGQLRALGVLLSLDDFGTGYSSLAYLQRLPLHRLKIDQRFVQRLPEHPADAVIARTIIGLAANLGLEALAEGVETAAQRQGLVEAGCQLFQGFLFAPPQPEQLLPV